MAKKLKRRSDPSPIRKLKSALTELSLTPPALSFAEGEMFVCSTCHLAVRECNANPDKACSNMLLQGTEIHLLRQAGKGKSPKCASCGGAIPKKLLENNPLTELCPNCQKASLKSNVHKRSKGVSP